MGWDGGYADGNGNGGLSKHTVIFFSILYWCNITAWLKLALALENTGHFPQRDLLIWGFASELDLTD